LQLHGALGALVHARTLINGALSPALVQASAPVSLSGDCDTSGVQGIRVQISTPNGTVLSSGAAVSNGTTWSAELEPLAATATPLSVTLDVNTQRVDVLSDVLVGLVLLVSGQSNVGISVECVAPTRFALPEAKHRCYCAPFTLPLPTLSHTPQFYYSTTNRELATNTSNVCAVSRLSHTRTFSSSDPVHLFTQCPQLIAFACTQMHATQGTPTKTTLRQRRKTNALPTSSGARCDCAPSHTEEGPNQRQSLPTSRTVSCLLLNAKRCRGRDQTRPTL
jgi:hypothetical protein